MKSNLKDVVTTTCAIVIAACAGVLGAEHAGQLQLSPTVSGILTLIPFIATAVIGVLTGKNPDGSTKSAEQVTNQNSQSK
jgi:hypothetical protein